MEDKTFSRRAFLSSSAKAGLAAAAAPMIVPRHVLGGVGYQAPSDTLGIAAVGIGGMGKVDLRNLAGGRQGDAPEGVGSENIVALCDVDWDYAAPVFERYPDAKPYKDYRRMLDEMESQIDGVVIATPDHTHAQITMDAMMRGLAVYTQKPLTWSVWEARQLGTAAESAGVVTQMGNNGASSDDARRVVEYLRAGTIGEVREVHIWTDRPIWPQGQEMPEAVQRVPETLEWDLWLGPAPMVDYHEAFHPFVWRGWTDWGTGTIGDIAAHKFNDPYWAFQWEAPTTVETRSTAFNGASYPLATTTDFEFPTPGGSSPIKLRWYDSGLMPPRPEELPEGERLSTNGMLYIGTEGKLFHGGLIRAESEEEASGEERDSLRFLSDELDKNRPEVEQLFERVPGEVHEMNWARAIKGQAEASSPFSRAAPMTESLLLGVVSLKAGNRKLEWDAENMRVTNLPEANEYLRRERRGGWELPTLASR